MPGSSPGSRWPTPRAAARTARPGSGPRSGAAASRWVSAGWPSRRRLAGIRGVTRRRYRATTRQDPAASPAPDLVRRRFTALADRPGRRRVADITELPTDEGKLYL